MKTKNPILLLAVLTVALSFELYRTNQKTTQLKEPLTASQSPPAET